MSEAQMWLIVGFIIVFAAFTAFMFYFGRKIDR